jgi:two-component system cell cycle sensor histidine kinase/response regulator CckA
MARHILKLSGYNVLEAASGSQAMEICKEHDGAVHLLLTDVVMPQMSGPRLGEEVIKMCPDIGILYMSGYTDNVIMHHGVLKAEVPFLQKPFSPDALVLKVRETLDTPGQAKIYVSKILTQNSSRVPQLVGS